MKKISPSLLLSRIAFIVVIIYSLMVIILYGLGGQQPFILLLLVPTVLYFVLREFNDGSKSKALHWLTNGFNLVLVIAAAIVIFGDFIASFFIGLWG
jgi:hypothetical protein